MGRRDAERDGNNNTKAPKERARERERESAWVGMFLFNWPRGNSFADSVGARSGDQRGGDRRARSERDMRAEKRADFSMDH